MSLQIISPPVAEPVTLAEVKARLRLTSTDDDFTITQHITTARVFAEKITRRSLASKTYSLTLERFPWPHHPIRLPVPPVSQVLSVSYIDDTSTPQTWSPDDYIVALQQMPAIIIPVPPSIYPTCTFRAEGFDAVTIQFIAGPAAGALQLDFSMVFEGIRMLAAHFYSHPEAVTSEDLREMPLGIQTLLSGNKFYGF